MSPSLPLKYNPMGAGSLARFAKQEWGRAGQDSQPLDQRQSRAASHLKRLAFPDFKSQRPLESSVPALSFHRQESKFRNGRDSPKATLMTQKSYISNLLFPTFLTSSHKSLP